MSSINRAQQPAHLGQSFSPHQISRFNILAKEVADLESVLSIDEAKDASFSGFVKAALSYTGNEYLFAFPPENFPFLAQSVAAVRIRSNAGDVVGYVYEAQPGQLPRFKLANPRVVGKTLIEFAENYADILDKLSDLLPCGEDGSTPNLTVEHIPGELADNNTRT